MATSFIQTATSQLSPAYNQQIQALQSQVNPISQMYGALNQGLAGQQQAGYQNVLEDASSRGILRSTMPVYGQAQVAQQITQKRGEYAGQQAKELGGIFSQIAGVNVDRASAIANLANALQGNFIQQQSLNNQIAQGNRSYELAQQTAQQQYQLALQGARAGF